MPVAEFVYLFAGMLDVEDPQATESAQERVARKVAEMSARVEALARRGHGVA